MEESKLKSEGYEKNMGALSYLDMFTVPDEEGKDIFEKVVMHGNLPYYYIDGKPHIYNRNTGMYTRVLEYYEIASLPQPKTELEILSEKIDVLSAKIDNIMNIIERSVENGEA